MTTSLPTINEEQAIDAASEQFTIFGERMSTEASLEWLETTLRDFLRRGLIETLKVIEAADQGDEIAHRALVCVFAEMQAPPAQLKAYVERAALQGPKTRKPGQHGPYDNWRRDIGIAVLVYWVRQQFGLSPTRNRESRRARRPSASSVVAAAMRRNGIEISESRVQNIWSRLTGAVIDFAATRQTFPSIMPS
jgi:hypothetical protein